MVPATLRALHVHGLLPVLVRGLTEPWLCGTDVDEANRGLYAGHQEKLTSAHPSPDFTGCLPNSDLFILTMQTPWLTHSVILIVRRKSHSGCSRVLPGGLLGLEQGSARASWAWRERKRRDV